MSWPGKTSLIEKTLAGLDPAFSVAAIDGDVATSIDADRASEAGATAVQICSALYLHKQSRIGAVLDGLKEWMKSHGFSTIDEFRGKMSRESSADPEAYERLQYIKVFVGIE